MNIEKYLGTLEMDIVEAMSKIDKNARGILYIVDKKRHLLGSVTDGDIRRWIINNGRLDGFVKDLVFKDVHSITRSEVERADIIMVQYEVRSVPVVNDGIIVDIIFEKDSEIVDIPALSALENTPVIVMAGGKGTRLYPYTKILPKPLIPIKEIPILERILAQLHRYGAKDFYVTVNYKKEMIKAYFSDVEYDYNLRFVDEEVSLGTAGGIRLIREKFVKPIMITNCDILINAEYDRIMSYHIENDCDMTIVSSLKNITIPYGVISIKEDGIVETICEKPSLSNLINTGMYILNPRFIDEIPPDTVYHMTDLANKMIKKGYKVSVYPIGEESYFDMGQFDEMKRMEDSII